MPTMNVSLTQELAEFVSHEVETGDYTSSSELVRDALRALRRDRDVEAEKTALLRRELAAGLHDAEKGEFSTRSVKNILEGVIGGNKA